jgi:hypothetical protein
MPTDDPWRKPDPAASNPYATPPAQAPSPPYVPPPGVPAAYAPPQGQVPTPTNGQPPYGPPGSHPYNPYYAPLPKPGGWKRLLWILGTVGVLVLGGCGVGIYFLVSTATANADEVNAFLSDVRDQQFTAAYQHLCPSVRAGLPPGNFATALTAAVLRGHGLLSYDITSSNTSVVSGTGTVRTAGGAVTFRDGSSRSVAFTLEKPSGHLCISSGFEALQ